jgi:hypothetical protein
MFDKIMENYFGKLLIGVKRSYKNGVWTNDARDVSIDSLHPSCGITPIFNVDNKKIKIELDITDIEILLLEDNYAIRSSGSTSISSVTD